MSNNCKLCGFSAVDVDDLSSHLKTVHINKSLEEGKSDFTPKKMKKKKVKCICFCKNAHMKYYTTSLMGFTG